MRIEAWHFLPDDRRMRYGKQQLVEVGKIYGETGPLVMCYNGMHGSRKIIDALQYAPGSILCKVEIWGSVIEEKDKLCGRYRYVISMRDITNILHEFACRCAEAALKSSKVTDRRSWAAIEAKRAWLRNEISDKELAAATAAASPATSAAVGNAAWDAAKAAAWYAAWAAAKAAAWDAAWAAAKAAAKAAASAAARAAVGNAAWDAARAAASAAAWAAARDEQDTLLTRMVEEGL